MLEGEDRNRHRYPEYEAQEDWSIEEVAAEKVAWEKEVQKSEEGKISIKNCHRREKSKVILMIAVVIAVFIFACGWNRYLRRTTDATQHCIYMKEGNLIYTAVDGETKLLVKKYEDELSPRVMIRKHGQGISNSSFAKVLQMAGDYAFYLRDMKETGQSSQMQAELMYIDLHTVVKQSKKLDQITFPSTVFVENQTGNDGENPSGIVPVPFVATQTADGINVIYSNEEGVFQTDLSEKKEISEPAVCIYELKESDILRVLYENGRQSFVNRKTGKADFCLQEKAILYSEQEERPLMVWAEKRGKLVYYIGGEEALYSTDIPYERHNQYLFHGDGRCHYLVPSTMRIQMSDYVDLSSTDNEELLAKITGGQFDVIVLTYNLYYWNRQNSIFLAGQIVEGLNAEQFEMNECESVVKLSLHNLEKRKSDRFTLKDADEATLRSYMQQIEKLIQFDVLYGKDEHMETLQSDLYHPSRDKIAFTEDGEYFFYMNRSLKIDPMLRIYQLKTGNGWSIPAVDFIQQGKDGLYWVQKENGKYDLYDREKVITQDQDYYRDVQVLKIDDTYKIYRYASEESRQTPEEEQCRERVVLYNTSIESKIFDQDSVMEVQKMEGATFYYLVQNPAKKNKGELYYYDSEMQVRKLAGDVEHFVSS